MPARASSADRLYLDHAAATPLRPEVAEAMAQAAADAFANPSSPHAAGRVARHALEASRERILALLGGRTADGRRDRLVFTSGATEDNRLGILGTGRARGDGGWIGVSGRDHTSIQAAATELAHRGWRLETVPLAAAGTIAVDAIRAATAACPAARPRILAVTTVCGQSGIREDLAVITECATADGLIVHADATQAVAWDEVDFATTPLATLALAPHKFGGPRGIGGLVVRGGLPLLPLAPGPQELGLRGGTEAVSLAVGFAHALSLAVAERRDTAARIAGLRTRLERALLTAAQAAGVEALVVGSDSSRAPHVALVAFAGVDRQAFAMAADLEGICLATGTACASGSSEPPTIVAAMGIPPRFRQGVVRLSLGRSSTSRDVDEAVARLAALISRSSRTSGADLSSP